MRYFSIVVLIFLIISCKSKSPEDEVVPFDKLYEDAMSYLKKEDYTKAAINFEKIFLQHPGHELAPKAELMTAHCFYMNKQYADAADILDIFISLHPRHKEILYARHLYSLSQYMQIPEIELDQSSARDAYKSLSELIREFPNSDYVEDASQKIKVIKNRLAAKEMSIGRYYLIVKHNPLASIKRFQEVVNNYETSNHMPEALYRLIEANITLGIQDVEMYLAKLKGNYSKTVWYENAISIINQQSRE